MNISLTRKQLISIDESTAFINIWEGSIRSGKTIAAIVAFGLFALSSPPGELMIVGPTAESIERNVIKPFMEIWGRICSWQSGKRVLTIGPREIWVVGAPDNAAYSKIQGATLIGAYCDELSLLPHSFYEVLVGRLSLKGARLFATTNPDSPHHWLKGKLDQADGKYLKAFHFTLSDNPHLPEDYIANIKRSYTGLYYKRYVEGKWVQAEGAIYDFFDEKVHCIDFAPTQSAEYIVGVDYGTTNPCSFVLVGHNKERYPNTWVEKEYYYDSRKRGRQKTDSDYATDFCAFIKGYPIRSVYIDPSAASFKLELTRSGVSNLYDAENEVLDGIRQVAAMLNQGNLRICRSCPNLIGEFQSYAWDDKSLKTGVDRPLKENDHALDALRYAIYTHFFGKSSQRLTAQDLDRNYLEAMGISAQLPSFFQEPQGMGRYGF
jgi:PBSX family phage terminase large subunit